MKSLTILILMMLCIPLTSFSQEVSDPLSVGKQLASEVAKDAIKSVAIKAIEKSVDSIDSESEVSVTSFMGNATDAFKLIKSGTASKLAIVMALLALFLQLLKLKIIQPLVGKNRLLVFAITTSVSGLISVGSLMLAGMQFPEAFMAGLVASGGAMAMYSAWRAFLKK